VIVHLVVSTVVLAVAIVAARFLPLTARTRHAVLLCGIAKFALPSEPFARLLRSAHIEPALPARVFGGATGVVHLNTPSSINWLLIAWASVATLILARWLLLRVRTVRSALRHAAAPDPREVAALARAIKATRVRDSIDILRSPVFEAPAVVRVIRPVIVLPDCDGLSGDELHALLCHECAHVARRDNFVALLAAAAGAALWFHPLVWLALHDLSAAREQACDERVAEITGAHDTYLNALVGICRNAVALRPAGVSCMAAAHIKERMEHLMNYETLKKAALPHRAVLAAAIVAVLAMTAIAATPPHQANRTTRYRMTYVVKTVGPRVTYDTRIVDTDTGRDVVTARLTALAGEEARLSNDEAGIAVRLRTTGEPPVVDVVVERGDVTVQETINTWSGEPLSMNLKDAELQDVLRTFGTLTGMKIEADQAITGRVSVYFTDVPWDQALDVIARQNGLTIHVEGKTIRISKN
jgi:beta-lactamase regulating signal transducer with metallopeptidase domain